MSSEPGRWRTARRGRLLVSGVVLSAGLILSRTLWLPAVGAFLVVADPLTTSGLVLPLAGELERVTYAAKLYKAGYAQGLLLTNLPLRTQALRDDHLEEAITLATSQGVNRDSLVFVPNFAQTTFDEAQNVRAELERRGIRSLLVVTSPWHTRRSRIVFRRVFQASGIQVNIQAVIGSSKSAWPGYPNNWWRTQDTRRATISEYLKLVAYGIGIR